jgi:hypothetical protein
MVTDQLSRAVPYEVRDFADRSVEQAKKAFDGFMGVVNAAMEGGSPQPAESLASAANLSRLAVGFAERNVQGALELAHNMLHATDLTQVLELQRDFLESQMKALKSQRRSLERASLAEGSPETV